MSVQLRRCPGWWRLALSVLLFALACALSWLGARALDRRQRIDAAVNSTHQLCVLPLLPAVLVFLIGTENTYAS